MRDPGSPALVPLVTVVSALAALSGCGGRETQVEPSSLEFVPEPGGEDPPAQRLRVADRLTSVPPYTVAATADWITITFGQDCPGPPPTTTSDVCMISVTSAGMSEGEYHAEVTFTDTDGFLVATVPVTFMTGAGAGPAAPRQVVVEPASQEFRVESGGPAPHGKTVTVAAPSCPLEGVWFVDDDAPPGGDGRSWATAFQHPQDAVDAASAGEEVWVAEGTYVRRDSAETILITMKDGVSLYGGFAGTETSRDDADRAANRTILDGEGACYHGVVVPSDARLDGRFRGRRFRRASGRFRVGRSRSDDDRRE